MRRRRTCPPPRTIAGMFLLVLTLAARPVRAQDLPAPSAAEDPTRTEGVVTGDIYGQIKVHDLDRDGRKEIVVGATDGMIHVYKYVRKNGQSHPVLEEVKSGAFPFQTAGPILGDVAVAETGDGPPRVYAGSMDGRVYCVDVKEGLKWAYATGGTITFSGPVVVPNEEGEGQVFVGSLSGKIFKLNSKGEAVWSKTMQAPVVCPLDVTGDPGGGGEQVVARDRMGNVVQYTTKDPAAPPVFEHKVSEGDGYWPVPVLSTDLNLDGRREVYTESGFPFRILKLSERAAPELVRIPEGKSSTDFTTVDLDRDGYNDLAVLENHCQDGCKLVVYDRFGKPLKGYPKKVGEYGAGAPKTADVDGDGDVDLVFTCWRKKQDGSLEGYLDALDRAGNRPRGFPKPVGKCVAPITVTDLDGDGKVELLVAGGVGGSGGSIILFRTEGRVPVRFEVVRKRFAVK